MVRDIGVLSLGLSFGLAVYATFASALGASRSRPKFIASSRNAVQASFGFLTLTVGTLVYSLIRLDFSLAYVANVASREASTFLRVTALWGGQSGSILFWAWLMAGLVTIVASRRPAQKDEGELLPYVISIAMGTTAFFIALSLLVVNPFDRLWYVPGAQDLITAFFPPANAMPYVPADGQGMNPLLRHFGMIGHPPTTYLGYTGFVIPFAYAMAALITGNSRGDGWLKLTRRWTLFAWTFLSLGLVLGGRWAYDVLGWGGFWGWDPVENAMLMPWLTGTAFLHSVMIQERRGMLKVWNMILIILTYSLSIFGTFITRTGLVSSVHAFAQSALGPAFFAFTGLTFLGSLSLLFGRLGTLRSENRLDSLISRESVFLLQNLIFLGITFTVFWGTIFPIVSELFTGTRITVGPPFYQQATGPLFAALVVLMAAAPYFAWRHQSVAGLLRSLLGALSASALLSAVWAYSHRQHPASFIALWIVSFVVCAILVEYGRGIRARMRSHGENPLTALATLFRRNRQRYGGYLVHLSVIMIALGFIGEAYFQQDTQGTLSVGQRLDIGGYSLRFDGLRQSVGSDGRQITTADVSLFKDGAFVQTLQPRRDYFEVQQQPVTIPGVRSTLGGDVYVLLVGWEDIGPSSSTFKVYLNPLVNWTWLGGLMLVLGAAVAGWPARSPGQHRRALGRYALAGSIRGSGE